MNVEKTNQKLWFLAKMFIHNGYYFNGLNCSSFIKSESLGYVFEILNKYNEIHSIYYYKNKHVEILIAMLSKEFFNKQRTEIHSFNNDKIKFHFIQYPSMKQIA